MNGFTGLSLIGFAAFGGIASIPIRAGIAFAGADELAYAAAQMVAYKRGTNDSAPDVAWHTS